MHPKPANAAMMRLKNRKTNVMKDIEEWVMADSEFNQTEAGRMSGKLTENITEERMLKSRLFDLGKERYKYLTKMAFDRHMFIEKQKRAKQKRQQVLHRSLSANDANFEKRTPDTRATTGRLSLDPKLLRNLEDETEEAGLSARAKTVQFVTSSTPVSNNRVTEQNRMRMLMSQSAQSSSQKPKQKTQIISRPQSGIDTSGKSFVKRNRFSHFGGRFPSQTHDHRYQKLASALSPNYESHGDRDVKTIVESIESLHVPAKNLKDVKPKLTLQLQAFMKERGITF